MAAKRGPNADGVVFLPNNSEDLTFTGEQVVVFAPHNTGTIDVVATDTATESVSVAATQPGETVAGSATAVADADAFIFGPANRGTLNATASATAKVEGDATAGTGDWGSPPATATLTLGAEPTADAVVFTPGNGRPRPPPHRPGLHRLRLVGLARRGGGGTWGSRVRQTLSSTRRGPRNHLGGG